MSQVKQSAYKSGKQSRAQRPLHKSGKRTGAKVAGAKTGKRKAASVDSQRQFRNTLRTAVLDERIQIEREGVPPFVVLDLIDELGVSATQFQRAVGIPKATFAKKMTKREWIGGTAGQSVIGLLELINKIEDMLNPDDNPAADDFDVEKWVGEWISRPQPALGGRCPVELMDTQPGREKVKQVLGSLQSGVYL